MWQWFRFWYSGLGYQNHQPIGKITLFFMGNFHQQQPEDRLRLQEVVLSPPRRQQLKSYAGILLGLEERSKGLLATVHEDKGHRNG
jgi:hypothetical protein